MTWNPPIEDLTDRQYGKLTVKSMHPERYKNGAVLWYCECACGGSTLALTSALRRGNRVSCGCLFLEVRRKNQKKAIAARLGVKLTQAQRENLSRKNRATRLRNGTYRGCHAIPRSSLICYQTRHTVAYRMWREEVRKRDGCKCVLCGSTYRIEVDHIVPLRVLLADGGLDNPMLYNTSNGRCLCRACHKKTPTYGGNSRISKRSQG